MNKAIIIGRIANDLQLVNTTNNNKKCEFSIAVDRVGTDKTDFLPVVVWNKQAENLVKYQKKGSLVAIDGSNRVDKYVNENGENRYRHYILANNIQFLGTKTDSQSPVTNENSPVTSGPQTTNNPLDMFPPVENNNIDDLELPF
jgi:single-strand DNA-binding protein